MTDRRRADDITDDDLDALYERLAAAEAALDRLGAMVTAWEDRLPDVIRTATAVDAIRTVLDRVRPAADDTAKETA